MLYWNFSLKLQQQQQKCLFKQLRSSVNFDQIRLEDNKYSTFNVTSSNAMLHRLEQRDQVARFAYKAAYLRIDVLSFFFFFVRFSVFLLSMEQVKNAKLLVSVYETKCLELFISLILSQEDACDPQLCCISITHQVRIQKLKSHIDYCIQLCSGNNCNVLWTALQNAYPA